MSHVYHPDETVTERPAGFRRAGYGDRINPLGAIGKVKVVEHIRDDGSATVYEWPVE